MNDTTNERILGQVMEIVGANSPLTNFETMTFSLQLLGWAKMSQAGEMKGALRMQQSAYADPNWLMKTWDALAKRSDILNAAYSNWKMPMRLSPSLMGAAIDLCLRLAETGMLAKFDPTDCFSQFFGKESGEFSLPSELADVMTTLANIEPSTSVYTPWNNSIQLAVRAARLGANAYVESIREPLLPALISMFVNGQIEVAQGDPIRDPSAVERGKLRQFDICLAFPPIGLRYTPDVLERDLYGRFRERTNSGTVLAIWHIMAQTRGRAVIAVPHSLLFSPGGDRSIREELLKRGLIEAVIAMPSGLLAHTNLSFALLVLNISEPRHSIRFVNAEDERFREPISKARAKLIDIEGIVARATGSLTDELVVETTTAEVFANDTMLQVNRYVLPESTRKTECLLASSQTKQLGEIVSILRPMPTSSDGAVRAWEVGAADLPEFAYIAPPTKEIGIDSATIQRNKHLFLQPLDIVMIIKGSVGKVGIVPMEIPPPGKGGWIAGQSAVILRVTNHDIMDPKSLAVYLRSPLGRELLDGIAVKGATIPLIQQRELQRLPVVIPPKKDSAEIGSILDEQASIQQEIEDLRSRQVKLAKQFWTLD
jgi:type I restriction enzyme M protein